MNFYNIISLIRGKLCLIALLPALFLASCEKYVDIDKAPNQLLVSDAYLEDGTATSAVLAMYSYYYTTYGLQYFTFAGELESGETEYQYSSTTLSQFQQSVVATNNSDLLNYMWMYPYKLIREANLAIEGLHASTSVTDTLKKQLLGEAKFFRAWTYFNMVNYFGGVPLVLSSDALTTASQPRASADEVYAQIILDLKEAVDSLPAAYTGGTLRTRVNKYAAAALLAKAYLHTKDYVNAEAMASSVINATDVAYSLPSLDNAFINTSSEVIFQMGTLYGYSLFGSNYRTTAASGIPNYCLTANALSVFEDGDNRRSSWVDSILSGTTTYYRINKYKLSTASAGNEYNIILRLGEQYLIRAEARAQQGNLEGAKSDVDIVRARAGLGNITASTQTEVLNAIAKERQAELFGEGQRWFDLKRTGTVDAVMSVLKPSTWTSTASLLPIPYSEILKNTALTQNDGYE